MPSWLRYTVIAVATLMMCSCQAALDSAALGGSVIGGNSIDKALLRGQSPETSDRRIPKQLPSSLTSAQLASASEPIADCPVDTGCACCSSCRTGDGAAGPGDEYLCDGGDKGNPASVRADWTVDGLGQEDTVAHYDTVDGRTVVTPSNQVCIYAPRFGAIRRVIDLRAYARIDAPHGAIQDQSLVRIDENQGALISLNQTEPTIDRLNLPPSLLKERDRARATERVRRVGQVLGRLQPYADIQVVSTGEMSQSQGPLVGRASLAAIAWTGNQAAQVTIGRVIAHAEVGLRQPGVVYQMREPNSPKLRLLKLASTDHARPGEEVEFTLRFDNIGDRVMGNVTIVDNLTTRLEYIEGSQKSTVEADFKTQPNVQGSLVVRWEIVEPLEPGDGGVIQFKCRVR
ncbi:hypothetical protein HG15A2_39050 [Adhaeretor mobilis]|uniref:Uncharacterized protein n=2 Tax=Adhaeretor mobilis TaxID=1930276 RepID=A0A517N0A9_9BACT|nr:hypothetical protein HG15A2_39050 [Adhaeretor mobilis]